MRRPGSKVLRHCIFRMFRPHQLAEVGLSLFAHAFELGPLLLRHELTPFLVPLRVGLFPHRLCRELRTLFHSTLRALSPTGLFVAMTCTSPVSWWKVNLSSFVVEG